MPMTCENMAPVCRARENTDLAASLLVRVLDPHAVAPVIFVDRHRKTTLGCPPSSDKKLDMEIWGFFLAEP